MAPSGTAGVAPPALQFSGYTKQARKATNSDRRKEGGHQSKAIIRFKDESFTLTAGRTKESCFT